MINDIRYSASQILELTNNMPVQITNFSTNQQNTSFEELMLKNNKTDESENSARPNFGTLGIPAGFNIDFSLLEENEEAV